MFKLDRQYTRIPMKWMHAEQGHITMCNVADCNPPLTGCLEAPGDSTLAFWGLVILIGQNHATVSRNIIVLRQCLLETDKWNDDM